MITSETTTSLPPAWVAALFQNGYALRGQVFCRRGEKLKVDGRWFRLSGRVGAKPAVQREIGQIGLWKSVVAEGRPRRVFEFPSACLSEPDDFEAAQTCIDRYLEWAQLSAFNKLAPGWQPPNRSDVEYWMPPGALSWQSGGFLRQGELILSPTQWILRFPILPDLPAELSPVRERALRGMIIDTNSRWRMVRLGMEQTGHSRRLLATVDLSGAPHSETLFLAGLNVLRHIEGWLVEPAELLTDPTITLKALEFCHQNNAT